MYFDVTHVQTARPHARYARQRRVPNGLSTLPKDGRRGFASGDILRDACVKQR